MNLKTIGHISLTSFGVCVILSLWNHSLCSFTFAWEADAFGL